MNESVSKRSTEFIDALGLSNKVSVNSGEFSTVDLSAGQNKRFALVSSYIEDRAIYLFDEWAVTQDTEFKKIFYCEILPNLKRNGKTVVVITHDDAYYEYSDRTVKLEDGMISASQILHVV